MTPQETLATFILAAKAIIYNEKRAAKMLGMFTTTAGAVGAVHAVLGAIEKTKPVPPQIAPLLGVSVLMLLLDLLQQSTGEQPPKESILKVAEMLMTEKSENQQAVPQKPPQTGLINQGV